MQTFYNIGIFFYGFLIRLIAPFKGKAKAFLNGRKHLFKNMAQTIAGIERPIWFHFASLGEFEQGRPVLEAIKAQRPDEKIIITFFSPSGFEIRKNYALADGVFYLPLDTPVNAKKFVDLLKPKMAIFTKYEFWPNYFKQLYQHQIPIYLISAIFRPHQIFFKWYGKFYRKVLFCVSHFFVQNEESMLLLGSIGINAVSLSGDTRFDRVFENANHPKTLPQAENFTKNHQVVVAGSTWPEDEQILAELAAQNPAWKFIIAPHEIGENRFRLIEQKFKNSIRFSSYHAFDKNLHTKHNLGYQTLIIDNIGMLSSLYQYGATAYIGGGFGKGIHNILEAAAFGLPIMFGPNYQKFQEAKDLINKGAAIAVSRFTELETAFKRFENNKIAAQTSKNYVQLRKGATQTIVTRIFA